MSWKDNLRQGSYRGVNFYIDTSSFTTGRRRVLHEFPNREKPFAEDLGKIAEAFEVEGHVIGDDYFETKNDLLRAFQTKGSGELIHPFWGSKIVQVGTVTISESNLEGAIAKFSANFVEAGDNRFPKGANDKGALLNESAENALTKSKEDFDESFSILGLPAHALESAREGVGAATELFNNTAGLAGDVADAITQLAFQTRNLMAEINDLLQAPELLSARLLDSLDLLSDAFSGDEEKTKALGDVFNFGDSDVVGGTPIKDQEKANQDALNNLLRRSSSIKSCQSAITADYVSLDDAESAREEISATLEAQLALDDGTEVFQALADLNADLVEALPDIDSDLPNIKEVAIEKETNTLLLTHDLFESIDNEQDIIDRNSLRDPVLITKGSVLEVLDA